MEDNKNFNEKSPQGENGGRRRRRRHKPNGEQGGQVQNERSAQPEMKQQKPNKPQPQKQQKQAQPQKQQNAQQQQAQNSLKKNKQNKSQGGQVQAQQPKAQNQGNKNQQNNAGKSNNKDENRKDTYLYVLDGNLYVNLTNKCSNACDFCVRNERSSYYGNYLWLRHGDPTVEKVIAAAKAMGDISAFKEVVFCGFGEPTYKVTEMVALCDYFHEKGLKTRLNTNGQGNLINKRDIVPDLKGKIDFVSISLNASCYEKYQPICRSQFRESGFEGMIEFAKICKRSGVACRFTIVDCIGEAEVEACKRLAESVHIPLYVRKYITDS